VPIADQSVPDAGDLYWIDFGSPFGREQGGRRPALVLTSQHYNQKSSVILAVPITRTRRDWPFQVPLPAPGPIDGFILVDQVRVIDPAIRYLRRGGRVAPEVLDTVRGMLAALFGIPVSN